MLVAGLDPGIAGAIAIIGPTGPVLLEDLATHQAQHGRSAKVKTELDLHAVCATLRAHAIEHCVLERVGPMPQQGLGSTWRFAESYGQLIGIVVALGIAMTLVRPQDWQRHHHIGPAPDAARQRAMQLYPAVAPSLARKRDHHRADALLLASYGRHALQLG